MIETEFFSMGIKCDHFVHKTIRPRAYIALKGKTRGDCIRAARAEGWQVYRDGRVLCAECKSIRRKL